MLTGMCIGLCLPGVISLSIVRLLKRFEATVGAMGSCSFIINGRRDDNRFENFVLWMLTLISGYHLCMIGAVIRLGMLPAGDSVAEVAGGF